MKAMADPYETQLLAAIWMLLILGSATLAGAWYFEIALGYQPCKLCLEQRLPYYLGLPLAVFSLILARFGASTRLVDWLLGALLLIFLIGAGLGTYHAGVEWGFWPGPTDCSGKINAGPRNASDLLGAIAVTKIISCSEAAWRLFGISMAGWNALVSALMVVIAAQALVKREE